MNRITVLDATMPHHRRTVNHVVREIKISTKKVECLLSRAVLRGGNNSNANSGLVYANANNASSNSNTNNGSRFTINANNRGVCPRLYNRCPLDSERHEPRQPSPQGRKPEHN